MRSGQIRETRNSGAIAAQFPSNSPADRSHENDIVEFYCIGTHEPSSRRNLPWRRDRVCHKSPDGRNKLGAYQEQGGAEKDFEKGASVDENKANWQMISRATKYSTSQLGWVGGSDFARIGCRAGIGGVVAIAMLSASLDPPAVHHSQGQINRPFDACSQDRSGLRRQKIENHTQDHAIACAGKQ